MNERRRQVETPGPSLRSAFRTTCEQVCDALRRRIISGQLKPGDRLVAASIAGDLEVSRTPVRDALKLLEREGLVEGRPMYGYRVRRPSAEGIEGLMHLRQAVECRIASLCAVRATKAQIVELRGLARQADDESSSSTGPAAVEFAFHQRLAQTAGYPELEEVLQRVLTLTSTFFTRRRWLRGDVPHRKIVKAIAGGDPHEAHATMHRHIEFAIKEFGARTLSDLRKELSRR